MRLKTLSFLLAALFAAPALADKYEFDKEHTSVTFSVNHLGFSDMLGIFTSYDGTFEFDEKNPEASKINVTLKPNGIRTSSHELDVKLRGDKFFNTAKFPEIRFVSKEVKVTGKNTGDVLGEVTMLGITKPVTLHVTFNKGDYHPFTNFYVAGFSANATLKRSEFGMNYTIPMVSDEVKIKIDAELVNQDRKKAEAVKK